MLALTLGRDDEGRRDEEGALERSDGHSAAFRVDEATGDGRLGPNGHRTGAPILQRKTGTRPLPDAGAHVRVARKHERTEELAYKALKAGSGYSTRRRNPANMTRPAWGRTIRRAVREGVAQGEDVFFTPAEYQDPRRTPYDITTAPEQQAQESITGPFANPGPTVDSVAAPAGPCGSAS
ncbi:hypothetical protein DL766_003006 [Monosporascus sp. MC13-8B]|uniref:Uncharacterized protein n=1 Tax=Monosporascus cannonballus TaxID=155416 RepID=A0ABY0GW49_9PEZI|nr:hypothetical protein DL762_008435 [Monosporascus cannonballus]RYO81196.1 hypothetical protein DL763_008642 [Monosporascus cannonballus]RYP34357.1 hypothetical protein DL766_003006 [Monosporascus sp. MC13-8B]